MPTVELTKSELKTLLKLVEANKPKIDSAVYYLPDDDEQKQQLEKRHARYLELSSKLTEALGDVPIDTHDLSPAGQE